jgi:Protein of unknown function (DUF1292).
MDRVQFTFTDGEESVEFFVLEQTKVGGNSYLLVTEEEQGDSECFILKELEEVDGEDIYDIVEDEVELQAVSKVFEELLEDINIEM